MNKTIEPGSDGAADTRRRGHLREIPAEAPSQTVGQELRAARQRRGDELAAVSRTLRIRQDHLEALEEGRLDDLPGRTYAVGFVRSYAAYLGLDAVEYVERFKAEISGRIEQSPLRGLPPDSDDGGLPYGWLLMGLLLIGIVGYAGYYVLRSANSPTTQAVAPVPAAIAPQATHHAPPPKHHAPVQQALAAHPPTVPGNGTPGPTGTPAVSGSQSVTPANAAANSVLAALPQGQIFGQQNHKARVILHAKTTTHVLVQGGGGRTFINRVLHPGDAYRVPDIVGLSLTTPDGGSVYLELDGQNMGVAGQSGQVTEALSLDPQAIVDRAGGKNPG
ncbi:MAG TPA: helix-turn-helix transcriptional regulator [Rhizomicrobium sp.]|jgi:cytoskeleton protein RodZ